MVYLAELLVVMTDGLKIVRIHPRNVHRVHGHKRLDDDASLSLQESDSVACSMRRGAVLLKHKNSSWEWPLSKKFVATVACAFFTLTPNLSNVIVKHPVLGKNLEHPRLTR